MELEFFCKPGEEIEWQNYWKTFASQWLKDLNINEENMRLRDHDEEELSHYSNATTDIEYRFPFGWGELWGIASRTDFDLKNIVNIQVKTLNITTLKQTKSMFHTVLNHLLVLMGVTLAFLCDAYEEEGVEGSKDARTVMHFHPALAPYKAAVLPLSKNYLKKLLRFSNN